MSLLRNFGKIANNRFCINNHFRAAKRSFYLYSSEPFHPIHNREPFWTTPENAISRVTSGSRIFVHGCAATPNVLLKALVEFGEKYKLHDVELIHILLEGDAEFTRPEYEGIFRSNSFFVSNNCREAVNEGRADFTPIFLSEIPHLFRREQLMLDVALIHVSPPDKHGFCTLGPSVDTARAAVQNAKYIIAQVNPQMPRVFGDGAIHKSHIDCMVECDEPLPELQPFVSTEVENKIGSFVAENLVQDGATLQMGIGTIPGAVTSKLIDHRDLGIHTEMLSDGVIDLVEKGVVTNAQKTQHTGKIVSSFAFGTKRLYDFINNNPFILMRDVSYTNHTAVICQNPKVTAINSCIEVDLTGQVCSESIGSRMYSGVGGQLDFMSGAALCVDGMGKPIIAMKSTAHDGTISKIVPVAREGVGGQIDFIKGAALSEDGLGKPIIAMTSKTSEGASKIVPVLHPGAGVTTTRAHVHYIVTEYGIAHLFGKTLRQRAFELIRIAHPEFREELEKASYERLKCMPSL